MRIGKQSLDKRDLITYWSFCAYACCTVVLPLVLVELFKSLNFPLDCGNKGAAGFLQMALSIFMVFSMLACGFCAGRWGKARSLAFANILLGVGIMALAFCPNYWLVVIVLAIAGLGEGFLEGLLTPYVQDCHPVEPTGYLNIAQAFSPGGMLLMVGITALLPLFGLSWKVAIFIAGGMAVIPGILFFFPFMQAKRDEPEEKLSFSTVAKQSADILKRIKFWIFFLAMFCEGIGEFCITFWIAGYLQLEYGASETVASLALGTWTFFMFLSRLAVGYWVKQAQLRGTLIWLSVLTVVITPLFPLVTLLSNVHLVIGIIFVLLAVTGSLIAPFWVSIQSYCTVCMPEQDDTMIFILLSCAGIPGMGVAAWLMGVLGDSIGLTLAFLLAPVSYLIMLLALLPQRAPKQNNPGKLSE